MALYPFLYLLKGLFNMKIKILFALWMIAWIFSCELDNFLFNAKKISKYSLPGNTIPDSLLELVEFQSGGYTLYGYWVKPANLGSDITILYCHGNKHNIDEYWDRVMMLHQLNVSIFIFDYRGYGLSEGISSEAGLYKDGESALYFIQSQFFVNPDSLCIYGFSLGNVVSIYLAAEKVNPLCLISEAPFASANSLTQSGLLLDLPPRWLTEGEFDNVSMIRKINTPFLLLHGKEDDFCRYRDNGKVVYENAPQPKSLNVISGANHNDIPQTMGIDDYRELLQNWINSSIN